MGISGNQLPTFDIEFKFAKIQNSHIEGGGGNQFPTFDAEFKFAKIQNSHVEGGWGVNGNQFPTFDAEFKFANIQSSHVEVGGGLMETNLQLLMQSSNLLISKIPMLRMGGGVNGNQFPTFDAEFKFAKIQNSHVEGGLGGWWKPISNF